MSLKESTISREDEPKCIVFIIDHHYYHRSTILFQQNVQVTGICVLTVQRWHLFLCFIFWMLRQFGERTTGHLIFKQSSALPPEFQLYTSHKDPLIVLQSQTILGVLGCSSVLQSSSSLDFKTYSSQILLSRGRKWNPILLHFLVLKSWNKSTQHLLNTIICTVAGGGAYISNSSHQQSWWWWWWSL